MKNYTLKENEVVLFKGMVAILSDWKEEKNAELYNTELLLTNYNIVLSTEIKKLFSSVLKQKIYAIDDVKVYDETVQIIRKKQSVDIYLTSEEVFLRFEKEKQAKEFSDKAIKQRDGNSKFVRSVKKTRKVIKETNEALDIDIVEMAKTTAAVACDVAVSVGTVKGVGTGTKVMAAFAGTLRGKSKPAKSSSMLKQSVFSDEENKNIHCDDSSEF